MKRTVWTVNTLYDEPMDPDILMSLLSRWVSLAQLLEQWVNPDSAELLVWNILPITQCGSTPAHLVAQVHKCEQSSMIAPAVLGATSECFATLSKIAEVNVQQTLFLVGDSDPAPSVERAAASVQKLLETP